MWCDGVNEVFDFGGDRLFMFGGIGDTKDDLGDQMFKFAVSGKSVTLL